MISIIERILILSDIHGNKEALQVIDRYLKKNIVDKIVCLGDVLGYGVDFKWCLKWIESNNSICIKGNHESMIIGETKVDRCSKIAKESTMWTVNKVDNEDINQVKRINDIYIYNNILFTHSGDIKMKWPYINDYDDAIRAFSNSEKINFFGHTHRAIIITDNETISLNRSCRIYLNSKKIYYINPGSVGQNRGTKTGVSFIVLEIVDGKEYVIEYFFYKYNSFKSYKKIRRNGMSKEIADYLIRERWKKELFSVLYKLNNIGGLYGR